MSYDDRHGSFDAEPDLGTLAIQEEEARIAMSCHERWAGELLTTVLRGWKWVAVDQGDPPGYHDLDILMDENGSDRIAVEVTTDTSRPLAALAAELRKHQHLAYTRIKRDWRIDFAVLDPRSSSEKDVLRYFKHLVSNIEDALAAVEMEGEYCSVRQISPSTNAVNEPQPLKRLRELGVRYTQAGEWRNPARITLMPASNSVTFGADDFVHALPDIVDKKRPTLLEARERGYTRTDLFVWIPVGLTDSPAGELSVRGHGMSDDITLDLDLEGIDNVWVASDAFYARYLELHGYVGPIFQCSEDGWRRWDRYGWSADR